MTEKQREIAQQLEDLVHQRFNKETLEKRLSDIFKEEIHIELGYEDVEDFPDYNYMFSSDNEEYGGDFDIYVLMHKNLQKDCFGNDMYVTEVGYDFAFPEEKDLNVDDFEEKIVINLDITTQPITRKLIIIKG